METTETTLDPQELQAKIHQESIELAQEFLNMANGKSYLVLKMALMIARDQIVAKEVVMMLEEQAKQQLHTSTE